MRRPPGRVPQPNLTVANQWIGPMAAQRVSLVSSPAMSGDRVDRMVAAVGAAAAGASPATMRDPRHLALPQAPRRLVKRCRWSAAMTN